MFDRIGPAIDFLNTRKCIEDPTLRISDLAGLCGYRSSRFHELFVAATGVTPQRYLTERRIAYACHLLKQSDQSILTVAMESGFNTQSRFYEAFKSVMGETPGAWRKTHADDP